MRWHCALAGAIFAGQMAGPVERVIVVLVSMLVALFIAADPHDPDGDADAGQMTGPDNIDPGFHNFASAIAVVHRRIDRRDTNC